MCKLLWSHTVDILREVILVLWGFCFFCSNTGLTPGGYKTLRSMQANWNWSCVCVPVWESMWYKISETRGVQGKTYNNSTPSVKETSTQWHRENQTLCLRFKRCIRTLLFVIHLLIAFCFLTVQVFGWFFFSYPRRKPSLLLSAIFS